MHGIPPWEPLSPEALADQRATYDRKRAACPVARSPRGVTLFRHADVVAAATDPVTFSSATSARRQVPNSLDPPEHTAFRAVIDPFFAPDRLRALEPRLRACAHSIVSALPRGAIVDAVTDLGYPFAVRAQADWLGWHGVEAELLAWMHENHAATRSADRARTSAVAAAFDEIVAAQVRRRRDLGREAPDDPTTELLRVRVDGRLLDDADIVSILRNWTAGDLGSIAAALLLLVVSLAVPTAGRLLFIALFAWAAQVNLRTALATPEVYLDYAPLASLDLYRQVIAGVFARHITAFVTAVALGLAGAIAFLVAIVPLGVGSGFPATLIMAMAAAHLLPVSH